METGVKTGNKYVILGWNEDTGDVSVRFSVDNSTQTLKALDLSNWDLVNSTLNQTALDYENSLSKPMIVAPELFAAQGKELDVIDYSKEPSDIVPIEIAPNVDSSPVTLVSETIVPDVVIQPEVITPVTDNSTPVDVLPTVADVAPVV